MGSEVEWDWIRSGRGSRIGCGDGLWSRRRGRCVWEGRLVENYMTRDDDFASGQIKTPISLMFPWVTKENTACRARRKFVVNGVRQVGKTETAECAKVIIGGMYTVK